MRSRSIGVSIGARRRGPSVMAQVPLGRGARTPSRFHQRRGTGAGSWTGDGTGSAAGADSDTTASVATPTGSGSIGAGTSVGSGRSEEHTSELQSLMRISYAVFCLKTKNFIQQTPHTTTHIISTVTHTINISVRYASQ